MTNPTTAPDVAPPRPVGRPRMGGYVHRSARIELRTTPDLRAKAQRLADAAGLTLSAWLERCIDTAPE